MKKLLVILGFMTMFVTFANADANCPEGAAYKECNGNSCTMNVVNNTGQGRLFEVEISCSTAYISFEKKSVYVEANGKKSVSISNNCSIRGIKSK